MSSAFLSRIRAALAAFDDDALAALANKGLVRRARKDLESAKPVVEQADEAPLRLRVETFTVLVPETPSQATCSCPAGGVCRHVLAALIFLKESAPETAADTATPVSAGEEVESVTDDALQGWAGKAVLRKAMKDLAMGLPVEFEVAAALVIRFPTRNVVCRWMPCGGLEGMVCSCHSREPCEHRVAAVLGWQVRRGKRDLLKEAPALLEASAGAVRTREEVLASVKTILGETIALGLSRLSTATEQRLRTLAVSAHGVDLPRLERMLRGLADEIALALTRDAQAASANLLAAAARIEALACALASPTPALVGLHRTRYENVGSLELLGLGARRWRTRSGYLGLTVYFWDRSLRNWATWTESRPVTTGGFDPAALYHGPGPWTGCDSPAVASRSLLRLMNVWRNPAGRLSGRKSTRCLRIGPSDAREVTTVVCRWDELASRAAKIFSSGLQEHPEPDNLVLLQPKAWEPAAFDEVRQVLTRHILDEEDRALPLVLSHTPETQGAVDLLEKYAAAAECHVLGLLRLSLGRLAVEPVALHEAGKTLNLTLDAASATSDAVPAVSAPRETPAEETDEPSEDEPELEISRSALAQFLWRMESELEATGEAGVSASRDCSNLAALAATADSLGMKSCALAVGRVHAELEQLRRTAASDPFPAAEAVLRAYYILRLASEQEAVARAVGDG